MKKRWDIGSLWKGRKLPSSVKEKISKAKKGTSGFKGKHWSKADRKRISLQRKKFFLSHKEARRNLSAKLKEYSLAHPIEVEEKVRRIQNYLQQHPEVLEKREKAIKETYENLELRKKISRKLKQVYKNPELRKKIDRAVTEWWREHPAVKKAYAEKAKKYFLNNPEKFKKFLEGGKNASKIKIRTSQDFSVRSSGEKIIAEFLFQNNISAEYEARTLLLEGWLCTPDFFLPDFSIFIEYYGGHPRAWKKKVIKNILYAKYKIPCIFITPAELLNLDYYLLKEIKKSILKEIKE